MREEGFPTWPERIELDQGGWAWRVTPPPEAGETATYIRSDIVPQWRPIETLPNHTRALCTRDDAQNMAVNVLSVYKNGCQLVGWNRRKPPTHWIPLDGELLTKLATDG